MYILLYAYSDICKFNLFTNIVTIYYLSFNIFEKKEKNFVMENDWNLLI